MLQVQATWHTTQQALTFTINVKHYVFTNSPLYTEVDVENAGSREEDGNTVTTERDVRESEGSIKKEETGSARKMGRQCQLRQGNK